jgi:hypothetical protein
MFYILIGGYLMQTFLPYENFRDTASVLDDKRCGKQRVEAFQILNILLERTDRKGWRNHPAVLMWKGYENALKLYLNTMISEWIGRGFNNTMQFERIDGEVVFPPFIGDYKFHMSHRSNLLRKDEDEYEVYDWEVPDYLPYIWGAA